MDNIDTTEIDDETLQAFFDKNFDRKVSKSEELLAQLDEKDAVIEEEKRKQEEEKGKQKAIREERRLLQLELKRLEEQESKVNNRNREMQKIIDKLKSMKI